MRFCNSAYLIVVFFKTHYITFSLFRNCRFHGPDKVANRPCPPRNLIAVLQFLLPSVMKALMYWFWDQCKAEEPSLNENEAPMLFFLHRLHACGWVTQQLMVNVMIDREVFADLIAGMLQALTFLSVLLLLFCYRLLCYACLSFL